MEPMKAGTELKKQNLAVPAVASCDDASKVLSHWRPH